MPDALDPSAAGRALKAAHPTAEYDCAECGRTFTARRRIQSQLPQTCSAVCRQRAWRRAHKAAGPAPAEEA